MFGSIAAKVAIGLVIVIAVMGIGGYVYFKHSQSVISTLTTNNARLEMAVREQEATIAAQVAAARRQNEQSTLLQQNLADAETRRRALETRIRRMNIEALARANSTQAQEQINSDAMQAFRDLEAATAPRDRRATPPAQSPMPAPRPPARLQGVQQ